ncbi:MAG: SPOR domain-containing protein [Pseudomonadota bacterium]
MDIAVKQRILGGVVLVAAAILFLPVVLEGAGVKALQPPAPPTPPSTPSTQDLAPAWQQQAQALAKDISASHGEPTFYPVEPALSEEAAPTPATAEQFRLVEPTGVQPAAAAVATNAKDKLAVQQLAANQAAAKATQLKLQAAAEASAQAKRDNAQASVQSEKRKVAEQKLTVEKKAVVEKAAATKLAAEKAATQKAATQKAATQKAAAFADPDPALPQVWVVQVARLNAQDKASAMVDKLRARGYRATVTGSADSWRVIIGPELDRSVAESVKRRLAEDPQLKLNGWIQAYRP